MKCANGLKNSGTINILSSALGWMGTILIETSIIVEYWSPDIRTVT